MAIFLPDGEVGEEIIGEPAPLNMPLPDGVVPAESVKTKTTNINKN